MKIINFGETNSILNQYISETLDVAIRRGKLRFRKNIERIGKIMAYEISKTLNYSIKTARLHLALLRLVLQTID